VPVRLERRARRGQLRRPAARGVGPTVNGIIFRTWAAASELAVRRHEQDASHPWSLSPASIAAGPAVERLVLPSPNGSAISAFIAGTGTPVVAACIRNATAVVRWLLDSGYGSAPVPMGVIAAGERWPDGSLRPDIEDLFGAGLVLSALGDEGVVLTPEATVAARSVAGLPPARLAELV
jgi:2-phosphosulfolactate phosphatase